MLSSTAGLVAAETLNPPWIAWADDWAVGPPEAGWAPDNSQHTYCNGGDFTHPRGQQAAVQAGDNLDRQTGMTVDKFGCTSNTDAVWIQDTDGSGDGEYLCRNRSGSTCFSATVAIRYAGMSSDNDWKQTACHELGHSVGLRHATNDCMGTDPNLLVYSAHHVDHINRKG